MSNKKKVIVYLYNRLFDPLIQSNFWLYIEPRITDSQYEFHLITYENPEFPLTAAQAGQAENWQKRGLGWTQLQWHAGTSPISKALDIAAGGRAAAKLRAKGFNSLVSLGSVAGGYAYLFCKPLGIKHFLYQFEPHSEYAIDNGMWSEDGIQYKVLNKLEHLAALNATVIASGTRFMGERLVDIGAKGRFIQIPTVANDKKFIFNQADRAATRAELGLSDCQYVLYYPGKFGDLYYREEIARMVLWLNELDSRVHLLIVTPHTDEEVHSIFDGEGVSRSAYTVAHSDYADIHRYASASDFAVIAVPPGPSKKFISNIKVGEYLCAGLPFLITRGISEDYEYAEQRDVGVVVDDFVEDEIKAAWPAIEGYLTMDAESRRAHCRQVGVDYRGFDGLTKKFGLALRVLTGIEE